jgi:predicted DNA-binding transcriptional regulator AlpA
MGKERGKKSEAWIMDLNSTFNEHIAAKFMGLAVQTLRNWRNLGKGPSYIKLGRCIRYRLADLEEYIQNRKINPERRSHFRLGPPSSQSIDRDGENGA